MDSTSAGDLKSLEINSHSRCPLKLHHTRLRSAIRRNGMRIISERGTRLRGRKNPLVTFFQCSIPFEDAIPDGNSLLLAAMTKSLTQTDRIVLTFCV